MLKRIITGVSMSILAAALGSTGSAAAPADAAAIPAFSHIIIYILENHSYSQIVGNPDAPYINGLIVDNPVATNYFGITHPSLPNYMALTGGDTFFSDNCGIERGGCTTPALSLVDRIEASGRTWKAYMEDQPTPCFIGDSYPYVEKHNPFIHYDLIQNNPDRCNRIVPYAELGADLPALPNYVWITPNECNDMHDVCDPRQSEVTVADNWLSVEIPPVQNSASCVPPQTCLIIITFDEGDVALTPPEDNHVFTIFVKTGPRPSDSAVRYDHYSLLRTVEDAWGLAPLTGNDGGATPMADLF